MLREHQVFSRVNQTFIFSIKQVWSKSWKHIPGTNTPGGSNWEKYFSSNEMLAAPYHALQRKR